MSENANLSTLFEVSWEVCNKVGGIYTVVTTKLIEAQKYFGERYFLLGPDFGNNAEFEETDEPCWKDLKAALQQIHLPCRFGRWNVEGRPKVILVDFRNHFDKTQLLHSFWSRFGVDSISGGWDYIEPVMFSAACGEIIHIASKLPSISNGYQVLAHVHEWMCGGALLYLKKNAPRVGTIFTTHATMLGRAMSGVGYDIYKQLNIINPMREAESYNITAKYSMESICAREADCFTTVSSITADEATSFLKRTPDVVTVNGIELHGTFDSNIETIQKSRAKILENARNLLRCDLPENTRIFINSGRYEYHNKGIDLFLDALGEVNKALSQSNTTVLVLLCVMGGHNGVNYDAINGDKDKHPEIGSYWLTSHYVYDQPNDPILNACLRLGLDNRPENRVKIIFNPAQLNGNDGFFNMPYDQLLSASDLGVFPSWYEPWGYTPQESAAYCVPTITTDLAGFGEWVRNQQTTLKGIEILSRRQSNYENNIVELKDLLLEYANLSPEELLVRKNNVYEICKKCTWDKFFSYYIDAYHTASARAQDRVPRDIQYETVQKGKVLETSMSGAPNLRSFAVETQIPEPISRIRELAHNLWWAWHPDAQQLFEDIDRQEWEDSNHNPVVVIAKAKKERLEELSVDPAYLRLYQTIMDDFDVYMNKPAYSFGELSSEAPVAYFSTEYGIHESLPIYSGGLGVLSGDHLKSASDLNIPLIGVGLLYKSGYFIQTLDREGRQVANYPLNDFSLLPIEKVLNEHGEQLDIDFYLMGKCFYANIWLVRVGRIKLYLLDTDTVKNSEQDRMITARLYEADRDIRLKQEILLGMGGVRMLRKMKIHPSSFHMNEGHSAFLVYERLRNLMLERGLNAAEAREVVRGSTIFTTHTPVDAGNEVFNLDRMEIYFKPLVENIGITWSEFVRTGRFVGRERNVFEMTVLALNYSFRANGVSELHGQVSRQMWKEGWPGVPINEIPIGHVTNGIHIPTYAGPGMRPRLEQILGKNWEEQLPDENLWAKASALPDDILITLRHFQKKRLLDYIRNYLPDFCRTLGVPFDKHNEMTKRLTSESLVIGFARRFAPYKRATLLFADIKRLEHILSDENRPVIFVFAGKAHPADKMGIDIMQEVIRHAISPTFMGKVFFIENYNISISRLLVQGCDVWLNTPRRPHEASGTSGQKVPVNGGLNLSISDGWWCEGALRGDNGWTIGGFASPAYVPDQSDYEDAESLYTLLEDKVIPLFFDLDSKGMPHGWLNMVRNSIATLVAQYSSHRMVYDYVKEYYEPAAERCTSLKANDFKLAKQLSVWKEDTARRFNSVKLGKITVDGLGIGVHANAKKLDVSIEVMPGDMKVSELLVQLVAGRGKDGNFIGKPDVVNLTLSDDCMDGHIYYTGSYLPKLTGPHLYGVRIMPIMGGLDSPLETRLVLWG